MNQLRVLLLGPPEISLDQTPVDIPSPFHKLILYYFASRGHLVSRAELDSVFNSAAASSSDWIDEAVSDLKDTLPDKKVIVSKGDLVGLDFEHAYIDQIHFRELLNTAGRVPWQTSKDQPLPLQTVKLLQRTQDLWRGNHFLEGIDYLDISQAEQEIQKIASELVKLRESVLERLAAHYYIAGDFQAAEDVLQVALSLNNVSDYLYYLRMKLFVEQGELSQAREYYRKVTRVMQAHGRVGPPPQYNRLVP